MWSSPTNEWQPHGGIQQQPTGEGSKDIRPRYYKSVHPQYDGGGHNVRSGCGHAMRGGFVINTKIVAFVLGLLAYRVIACFVSLIESYLFW